MIILTEKTQHYLIAIPIFIIWLVIVVYLYMNWGDMGTVKRILLTLLTVILTPALSDLFWKKVKEPIVLFSPNKNKR